MNNKCVYLHKDLDGTIFYVGSGTTQRAMTKELSIPTGKGTSRGLAYQQKVQSLNFNYEVEIVKDSLTKDEAVLLEFELIAEYSKCTNLVNVNKPSKEIFLDPEIFSEYFKIDPLSPTGLSWNKNRQGQTKYGDPTNTYKSTGYYRVKLYGQQYLVHRIIMALLGYNLTDMVVDHIDGDGYNNCTSNLRVITQAENRRNSRKRVDNTTEYTGLSYCEDQCRWIANWYEHGKRKTKTFYIINYSGSKYIALAAAISFRKEALKDFGYTENHGE